MCIIVRSPWNFKAIGLIKLPISWRRDFAIFCDKRYWNGPASSNFTVQLDCSIVPTCCRQDRTEEQSCCHVQNKLPVRDYPHKYRLLRSPSLVAIWLLVGYETWPHPFVIGYCKYKFGLPNAPLHYGLTWPVGIPIVFQTLVTVPLHSPDSRRMPAVRAVQGDCERV